MALGEVKEDWLISYLKLRIFIGKHGENEDLSVGNWDVSLKKPDPKDWNLVC